MMRFPGSSYARFLLAITAFAIWFSLFHNYPAETTLGFFVGVPLLALLVLEMVLDDRRNKERRMIFAHISGSGSPGSLLSACTSRWAGK